MKAHSGTRRRCGRCCPCASAAGRVLRPPPPPPHRSPQPPREPCSGWCRGRPGKPTGRCRCWRGLSRLSLASRGVCPAKAASEDPAPLPRPAPPRTGLLRGLSGPPTASRTGPEPVRASAAAWFLLLPPMATLLICVCSSVTPVCSSLCLGRPAAATWCLSPLAGGEGTCASPLKGFGSGSGWVVGGGWTSLEDIKETQKLPVRVPPSH